MYHIVVVVSPGSITKEGLSWFVRRGLMVLREWSYFLINGIPVTPGLMS